MRTFRVQLNEEQCQIFFDQLGLCACYSSEQDRHITEHLHDHQAMKVQQNYSVRAHTSTLAKASLSETRAVFLVMVMSSIIVQKGHDAVVKWRDYEGLQANIQNGVWPHSQLAGNIRLVTTRGN